MSPEDAQKEADKEYAEAVERTKKTIEEYNHLRELYEAMLRKVRAWQPPTSDHQGLKDFMIEQITGSIDFDCDTKYWIDDFPQPKTGAGWLGEKRKKAMGDLSYHSSEHSKEVSRVDGRNAWIKALKESLKGEEK